MVRFFFQNGGTSCGQKGLLAVPLGFFFWCRSSSILELVSLVVTLDTQLGVQYLGQCIDKIIPTNTNQIEIQNTFIQAR